MAKHDEYKLLKTLRDELNRILGDGVSADTSTNDEAEDSAADDFSSMTFAQLKAACKKQGLPTTGSRSELIDRLTSGGDDSDDEDEDEQEEEKPAKKSAKAPAPAKKTAKKPAADPEPDEDEEDDGEADEEQDEIYAQVEEATKDMSLEEIADFCAENNLSSKGKRQALIERIVKAVKSGDIELSDDEDEDEADEEDDGEEDTEENETRAAAVEEYAKDVRKQFKNKELDRASLVSFLCDFHGTNKRSYTKKSDSDILEAYIEASSCLIGDDGELHEEGAYTVNDVPYCCGHELTYDKKGNCYVCEYCGEKYNAEEDDE